MFKGAAYLEMDGWKVVKEVGACPFLVRTFIKRQLSRQHATPLFLCTSTLSKLLKTFQVGTDITGGDRNLQEIIFSNVTHKEMDAFSCGPGETLIFESAVY